MSTSIKFNGKEVQNPFARVLVALLVVVVIAIVLFLLVTVGLIVLPAIMLGLVVITLPLHIILKLSGRRGFYIREGDTHTWTLTGAFDRV